MFFWTEKETNQRDTKASLHVNYFLILFDGCHNKLNPYSKSKDVFPVLNFLNSSKRTFHFTPSRMKASMTVEATLAFSFFLFFVVNIFSLIFLFIQYGERMEKLQQQGKELAMYAYSMGEEIPGSEELIRLMNMETIESPFPILAAPKAALEVKCVIKPWTGYDVTRGEERQKEEEIVFMTDHGEVYHRSRNCTHLTLSVQAAPFSEIKGKRNEGGSRYTPCEQCGDNGFATVVYITSHGSRYHFSLGCRGLKRTVRAVYLSQIPGVPSCSKCGG